MKISVVTVHDSANFGSFLQAYALQNFLEKEGHKVYFIKTRDKKYVKNLYYNLRPNREWIKHPLKGVKGVVNGIKKYKLFKNEQACFEEIENCDNTDITVLGSDEIWNVKTPVFTKPLFYGAGCKNVIAYAVSAGWSDKEDFSDKKEIISLIKKINEPLVRDDTTADLVAEFTGIRPEIVCDPTLLADKDIFKREFENSYIKKHKYILIYAYEPEIWVRKLLKEFAKQNNLKLVSVGLHHDWTDYNIHCSPLDFCGVLDGAEYVITTTFHGSIFSVLNHKKFVAIPLSQKTDDILKKLGLKNQTLSFDDLSIEKLENKLFYSDIDYAQVDKKIEEMRSKSEELLKRQIKLYMKE